MIASLTRTGRKVAAIAVPATGATRAAIERSAVLSTRDVANRGAGA